MQKKQDYSKAAGYLNHDKYWDTKTGSSNQQVKKNK